MSKSEGYRYLMASVKMSDDGDPWGVTMGWLFALAEVALVEYAAILPGFSPSPIERSQESLCEEYGEAEQIYYGLNQGMVNRGDIEAVYAVLSRYAGLLRMAGKDY